MQTLPAVGREDRHAQVTGEWIVAEQCTAADNPEDGVLNVITQLAAETRIVIVNEAHDRPHHREITRQIAMAIAPLGYTHFAAEAIDPGTVPDDPPPYARTNYGNYVNEPVFGRLVRTVRELGMTLVAYDPRIDPSEASLGLTERVELREERQATRLAEIVDELPEDGRILIHVGYSHASEVPIPFGDGDSLEWMASRLKHRTGIDPLTIDQTNCISGSQGVELSGPSPSVWRHAEGQFDVIVAHPNLEFVDGRPTWRVDQSVIPYTVPDSLISQSGRTIVEARLADEPIDAVPIDRVMLWPGETVPLLLPAGAYRIVGFHEDSDSQLSILIDLGR